MNKYSEIKACRAGGGASLIPVLSLGNQSLTGIFPKDATENVTKGPLDLVWCPESCLLQLRHNYSADEMYGENYGYRSGLNQIMVDHLSEKVQFLEKLAQPGPNDIAVDIGSNDATLLKSYTRPGVRRIGIDPTGKKFKEFYPKDIELVPDFFSFSNYRKITSKAAKIITSIAMFYDLEDPVQFAKEIKEILSPNGIWHFEQSYMPSMLRTNSYDTICHEHLEYYSLQAIQIILSKVGLKVIDVKMNNINGGSFALTVTHEGSKYYHVNQAVIEWLMEQEDRMGLNTPRPFRDFEERVFRHRKDLVRLIKNLVADGKKILGYGASTKGNVLLQFCSFSAKDLPAIAEVNTEKFGRVTPGTHIPIISEVEARKINPDYFFVLPWHFKDGIIRRERKFLQDGGKFIFPFPEIEII
jgi:C-methyltransferase C-terminal domain/Putative zinc binding domain/Methyltransferase domain